MVLIALSQHCFIVRIWYQNIPQAIIRINDDRVQRLIYAPPSLKELNISIDVYINDCDITCR